MSERLTKEEWEAVSSLAEYARGASRQMTAVERAYVMLERRKPSPDLAALADDFFANPCLETRKSLWLALMDGDVSRKFLSGFVRPGVGAICALPDSFQNPSYPIRIS